MSDWEGRMAARAAERRRYALAEEESRIPPICVDDPRLLSAWSRSTEFDRGHILSTAVIDGKTYRVVKPI